MRRPCRHFVFVLAVLLPSAGAVCADLASVRAERNLERRSQKALDNAERAFKSARDAYKKGNLDATAARISEVRESVELAEQSLIETGKDPRRNSKWFKRAEIRTRGLLRKMEAFEREMMFADRGMLAETKSRVEEIHDDLLKGIMGVKENR